MEKTFFKECKFFVASYNHSPHCLWIAMLSPESPPEKLENGCKIDCQWNQLTNSNKSATITNKKERDYTDGKENGQNNGQET